MNDRTEIIFLKKILEQYRINVHLILESESNYEYVDKGIREYLGLNDLYAVAADLMKAQLASNIIYQISDDFYSKYLVMVLPDDNEACYLVIGPYTETDFNKMDLIALIEKYHVPQNIQNSLIQYYITIPYISDSLILQTTLCAFYETVWGNEKNYIFKEVHHNLLNKLMYESSDKLLNCITDTTDVSFKMRFIEERYQIESDLIKYVSQGNYTKAAAALSGMSDALLEPRASTRLRDYKNYSIVLNTILRKGAEAGLVHPIHIDKLSSIFAKKIESITSLDQGKTLFFEMLRKYCFLVKNHSLKEYSLLVRKVVTRIESDLTADQSLKVHAQLLNVHPSYLSSIFRKETGITLTDYVNMKRIEYSIFLLNTTNMQIQMIAQQCGIPNLTYFERIFKKQIGRTPSEYKKELHR